MVEVHLQIQTDLDLNYYQDDDYSNPKFDQIQVGARFLTVLELEEGVQSASIQSPDLKAFPHFSYKKNQFYEKIQVRNPINVRVHNLFIIFGLLGYVHVYDAFFQVIIWLCLWLLFFFNIPKEIRFGWISRGIKTGMCCFTIGFVAILIGFGWWWSWLRVIRAAARITILCRSSWSWFLSLLL